MKKMKKIIALLIAMAMVLGMSASVFAATITVENAYSEETYDAYKILEYTSNKTTTVDEETGEETPVAATAFSYYLLADDYNGALGTLLKGAGFEFTESSDKTLWFVNNADDFTDGKVIADYLYKNLDTLKTCALDKSENNVADDEGKVTMEDLAQGYWFVTSSVGSLCTLQSYNDDELVIEKNELITPPTKVASDTEFQVGDTITYTITYTDVDGTNNDLILTDKMSEGLTYQANTLKVKINDVETDPTGTDDETGDTITYYTVTPTTNTAGATLKITVDAAVMNTLKKNETIVVTYDVVVNNNASLDGTELNTVTARTSEQETTPTTVIVESFDLTVNKTDGTNALKGAQFELYRTTDASGATAHEIVHLRKLTDDEAKKALATYVYYTDENKTTVSQTKTEYYDETLGTLDAATVYYVVDTSAENTTIDMALKDENGEYIYSSARIFGIDKDSSYGLLETKAPEGYNKLDEETPVAAGDNTVDVINNAGSTLPSTGGIGTTIFYVVGSILVIGAGVVMITRRRMGN
jgi:fimbrial isopeptide formation D2 family protein/LPXTG-motif cell wall-anchored protein